MHERVMFCDRCGANAPPGQRFCGKCGKDLGAPAGVGYPAGNRVQEHVRLLGIFWLILAGLSAIGGLAMFGISSVVFRHMQATEYPQPVPGALVHTVFRVLAVFILAKAAAEFAAGWGLLKREPWARMLTIVLSFFALLNIPFGTALGIYSLWVLLPERSAQEYAQETRNAGTA